MTEVNGSPGTSIIDVTGHNHFLGLVKHVAKRKVSKAKFKSQDNAADAQVSAMGSYPTDMIHAGMTPQQTVDAFAGLILNDATPEKIYSLENLGEEVLDRANALEPEPVVDDMTKIAVDLHVGEDRRYGAYTAQTPAPVAAPARDKWGNVLSEASAQALEMFKKLRQ